MPVLEIFSQGEEVITGQVVDSNAAWLAQEAVDLGFQVGRHTSVGDKLVDLIDTMHEISRRADCCLCTGGLGPTTDDLTAEAVAAAFKMTLEFDETAFAQIQRYFQNRKRPMADCNRKQAMLPQSALRLENMQGTAPGFAVQAGKCLFIFMPGVPSEMKAMFAEQVRPILQKQFKLLAAKLITLRTLGIGESDLQERLKQTVIPASVQLGYRAEIGEVQVKLLFPHDFPELEREKLTTEVAKNIGDPVYAIDGLDRSSKLLVDVIDKLMTEKKYTLSVMESISHGLVSSKLYGVSWLKKSVIQPESTLGELSNKTCGVTDDLHAQLKALADVFKRENKSEMALIQLPIINTHERLTGHDATPVSTGLLVMDEFFYKENLLTGTPARKQNQASTAMFDLLRRYLQNLTVQS